MNVFIGSGQSLVVGTRVQRLGGRRQRVRSDAAQRRLSKGASGDTPLDTSLTGGTLGGLLEFRSADARPDAAVARPDGRGVRAAVQRTAFRHGPARQSRRRLLQHRPADACCIRLGNAGSGTATAAVADLGAFTGGTTSSDFDGAAYSLRARRRTSPMPLTGSGTAADPFVADGIEIVVGGRLPQATA